MGEDISQVRKRTTEVSESVNVKEEKADGPPTSNKRPNLSVPSSNTSSSSSLSTSRSPIRSKSPGFSNSGQQMESGNSAQQTNPLGTTSGGTVIKRRWSKQEDEKLCAAVKGVGLHDWKTIAEVYMAGHELSDAQCMHRWQKVLRPGLVKGAFCEKEDKVIVDCLREGGLKRRWTKQEDEKLCNAVKAVGTENWKEIAEVYLAGHGRSEAQCLHRWQKVLRAGLVKGAFTEEEDKIIIECMQQGGLTWMQIADRIPGRIGKQCRERWTNHLDPNLKKGGWSHDEDTILAEAQQRWGNAWTKIAKLLPGRAENAVKNRWNSAFRRKKSAMFGKVPAEEDTAAVIEARLHMEAIDREEQEREAAANEAHSAQSKSRGKRASRNHQSSRAIATSNQQTLFLGTQRASIEAFQSSQLYNEGEPSPADANAGLAALSKGTFSGDDDAATLTHRSVGRPRSYKSRGAAANMNSRALYALNLDGTHPNSSSNLRTSDSPSMDVLDQFFAGDFASRAEIDEGFLSLAADDDEHNINLRSVDLDVSLDNLDLGVHDHTSDFVRRAIHNNHTNLNNHHISANSDPLTVDDEVDDQVNFFGPGRSGLSSAMPKNISSGFLSPQRGSISTSLANHTYNPFGSGFSINNLCTSQDDLVLPQIDVNASIDRTAGDFRRRSVSLGDEYMSQEYASSWTLMDPKLSNQQQEATSHIHNNTAKTTQPLLRNISTATEGTTANVTMDHTMTQVTL
mmetsp:Transcript_22032/g.34008  ORF Transcript_22032/g.34008 Transcript_22032/m.34008 type:complete len:737 (-) Transcript_22032:615-2825(-)